ncbi:MAG: aldo/keto reductase [Xanthomonadales bacterium]|nr:aldo/keto reductase [Gammaproteobacteria bacterium]MBT8053926.1 aldo/keto reductase [Gammaproteobacteria bacterium]NND58267.1 aldo/keto reductase [Xanthomonadales bacterium]NNK52022.1 aldo/keto reductase [Xanthomonadales bacterium]
MKLTRRHLLRMGAGAGLLTATGGWNGLLAGDLPLIHTTIPATGQQVPAVGIGTVRFRGNPASAEVSPFRETLKVFHQLGGRLIDTSPNYGNSEAVLGRLLEELGLRDQVFMATKVDREDQAEGIERMQGSFRRLGGSIDLMQVHNLRGTDVELETMMAWKAEGRIRYIGVTTHRNSQHAEMEQVMRRYPLDFVQVNYSLADRAAAERILPLAQDRGVAVLVNRPFGKGELFRAVKGVAVPGWAADFGAASWGQLFLKYIISHPAETLPIPGTSKPHHAEDNMGAMLGGLPDESQRKDLENLMEKLI